VPHVRDCGESAFEQDFRIFPTDGICDKETAELTVPFIRDVGPVCQGTVGPLVFTNTALYHASDRHIDGRSRPSVPIPFFSVLSNHEVNSETLNRTSDGGRRLGYTAAFAGKDNAESRRICGTA